MILDCWKIILNKCSNTTLAKFMITKKENLEMIKNNLKTRYNSIKTPNIYVILKYDDELHNTKYGEFGQSFKFINMNKKEIVEFLIRNYYKYSDKSKKEPSFKSLLEEESKFTFRDNTYYLMHLTPDIIKFFKHAYSDGPNYGDIWRNMENPKGGRWDCTITYDHTCVLLKFLCSGNIFKYFQ